MKAPPFFFLLARVGLATLLFSSLPLRAMVREKKQPEEEEEEGNKQKGVDATTRHTQEQDLANEPQIGFLPPGISTTAFIREEISNLLPSESKDNNLSADHNVSFQETSPMHSNISSAQARSSLGLNIPSSEEKKLPSSKEVDEEQRQALLAEIRKRVGTKIPPVGFSSGKVTATKIEHIRFEGTPGEEEEGKQPSKVSKKNKLPKTESDQAFKKNVKAFKNKIADLEIAVEEIKNLAQASPEQEEQVKEKLDAAIPNIKSALKTFTPLAIGDLSRLGKVVAIYKEAVPEVKELLRTLFKTMTEEAAQEFDQKQILESSLADMMQLFEKHLFFNSLNAEAKSNQISEEDPEKSSKVATIYTQAYQEAKPRFESLLIEINKNPELVDREAALQVARSSIQLLEIAFKTIDREKMRPIKIQAGINDHALIARKIPWEPVPYEQLKEEDDEALCVIDEAANAKTNLQKFMAVFSLGLPDAEIRRAFYVAQDLEASNISQIAFQKKWTAYRKMFSLQKDKTLYSAYQLEEASKAANSAHEYAIICLNNLNLIQEVPPSTTESEVKRASIQKIIDIVNTIPEKNDRLINIFATREK